MRWLYFSQIKVVVLPGCLRMLGDSIAERFTKIRKKKVNRKEVQLLCARLSNMINSDSLDMNECKAMYEARYMVRTLQRRIDDMCDEKEDVPFNV